MEPPPAAEPGWRRWLPGGAIAGAILAFLLGACLCGCLGLLAGAAMSGHHRYGDSSWDRGPDGWHHGRDHDRYRDCGEWGQYCGPGEPRGGQQPVPPAPLPSITPS